MIPFRVTFSFADPTNIRLFRSNNKGSTLGGYRTPQRAIVSPQFVATRRPPGRQTGDRLLGLEWVGDTDPKMLNRCDKRMAERFADAVKSFESVREVSVNTNAAPEQGGANMETEE